MDTKDRAIETARSLLGTLALESNMAGIALRGVRKHGPAAFAQSIQRIAALTRQLEEISGHMEAEGKQLHLGIEEAALLRSRDGSDAER